MTAAAQAGSKPTPNYDRATRELESLVSRFESLERTSRTERGLSRNSLDQDLQRLWAEAERVQNDAVSAALAGEEIKDSHVRRINSAMDKIQTVMASNTAKFDGIG